MDEGMEKIMHQHTQDYKRTLDQIIEKYSKLQYCDNGQEVDFDSTDIYVLSRWMNKSKKKLTELESKSMAELREESFRAQNSAGESQLNFTNQDDDCDQSAVSTSQPSTKDIDLNCSNETKQTVKSLDECHMTFSEVDLQPEDEDDQLETTLSSNGSSLVDLYPGMVSRVGRACHRQHVTNAAGTVLRKYHRWRNQSRVSLENTFEVSVRPDSTTETCPKDQNKKIYRCPPKNLVGTKPPPRSPLQTVPALRRSCKGRGSSSKEPLQPILVMDLSGPMELSLNETFTVSELSPHKWSWPVAESNAQNSPRSLKNKTAMSPSLKFKQRSSSADWKKNAGSSIFGLEASEVRGHPRTHNSLVRQKEKLQIHNSPVRQGERAFTYTSPVRQKTQAHNDNSPVRQGERPHIYNSPERQRERPLTYSSPVRQKTQAHNDNSPVQQRERPHIYNSPDRQGERHYIYNSPVRQKTQAHNDNSPVQQRERLHIYNSPVRQGERSHIYNSPVRQKEKLQIYNSPVWQGEKPLTYHSPVRQKTQAQIDKSPVRQRERPHIYNSPVRQSPLTETVASSRGRSTHVFLQSPDHCGSRGPMRPRSHSTSLSSSLLKPAGSETMLHPRIAPHSRPRSPRSASKDSLRRRRHLSFESSLPPAPASLSTQQLDEQFKRFFHKFVCQSKSPLFEGTSCRVCCQSAEVRGGHSSSMLAALALSPHCTVGRKRHRESGCSHPQSKRPRDEYFLCSPRPRLQGREMLRRCLYRPEVELAGGAVSPDFRKHRLDPRDSAQQHAPLSEYWTPRRQSGPANDVSIPCYDGNEALTHSPSRGRRW